MAEWKKSKWVAIIAGVVFILAVIFIVRGLLIQPEPSVKKGAESGLETPPGTPR